MTNVQKKLFMSPRLYTHIDELHNWKHGYSFFPVMAEISPVSYCNQKCKYCYTVFVQKKDKLPDNSMHSIVDGLIAASVKGLRIQGIGEPTLHPDLASAITRGGSRGLYIALITNGVLLTPEFLEGCLSELFSLKVSVIDSDQKRYALFHGTNEGQWKSVVDNISYAADLKAKCGLNVSLHATVYVEDSNCDDVLGIVEFCKNIGFDFVTINRAFYSGRTANPDSEVFTSFNDKAFFEDFLGGISILEDDSFVVNVSALRRELYELPVDESKHINCPGIHFSTIIDANGFVFPCWRYWGRTDYSYGNILEESFIDIWRSQQRKEINDRIETEFYSSQTCSPCGHRRINEQLLQLVSDNPWVNFLT